jgi:arginase
MGNGPPTLLDDHGLVEALRRRGLVVEHEEIPDVEGEGEVARTLELDRVLANVALVGVRDLALYQRAWLEGSAVRAVHGNEIRKLGLEAALVPVLDEISSRAPRVYLHVDLDSLDPSEGRANQFAAPGGLSLAELRTALDLVSERFDVRAAAVTAYDPAVDEGGRMGRTAVEVAA